MRRQPGDAAQNSVAARRAGQLAVRSALAKEIADIAASRGMTQVQTAEILGIAQPKVSALFAGKVEGFSLDRLVHFLNLLGEDIHIIVLPKAPSESEAVTNVMRSTGIRAGSGWSYA